LTKHKFWINILLSLSFVVFCLMTVNISLSHNLWSLPRISPSILQFFQHLTENHSIN
jgi:hypothetical protein